MYTYIFWTSSSPANIGSSMSKLSEEKNTMHHLEEVGKRESTMNFFCLAIHEGIAVSDLVLVESYIVESGHIGLGNDAQWQSTLVPLSPKHRPWIPPLRCNRKFQPQTMTLGALNTVLLIIRVWMGTHTHTQERKRITVGQHCANFGAGTGANDVFDDWACCVELFADVMGLGGLADSADKGAVRLARREKGHALVVTCTHFRQKGTKGKQHHPDRTRAPTRRPFWTTPAWS